MCYYRKGLYQLIERGDFYRAEDIGGDPGGKGDYIPVPLEWIGTETNTHWDVIYVKR